MLLSPLLPPPPTRAGTGCCCRPTRKWLQQQSATLASAAAAAACHRSPTTDGVHLLGTPLEPVAAAWSSPASSLPSVLRAWARLRSRSLERRRWRSTESDSPPTVSDRRRQMHVLSPGLPMDLKLVSGSLLVHTACSQWRGHDLGSDDGACTAAVVATAAAVAAAFGDVSFSRLGVTRPTPPPSSGLLCVCQCHRRPVHVTAAAPPLPAASGHPSAGGLATHVGTV